MIGSALQVITVIVTAAGLLGCIVFCTAYMFLSDGGWRKTEAGRFLMLAYFVLGSLFALILSVRVFGEWPGRQVLALTLYVIYTIFAWWPLRLLWISRKKRSNL